MFKISGMCFFCFSVSFLLCGGTRKAVATSGLALQKHLFLVSYIFANLVIYNVISLECLECSQIILYMYI